MVKAEDIVLLTAMAFDNSYRVAKLITSYLIDAFPNSAFRALKLVTVAVYTNCISNVYTATVQVTVYKYIMYLSCLYIL